MKHILFTNVDKNLKLRKVISLACAAALLLVGCTRNQNMSGQNINPLILDAQNIISTRPQNTETVLTVLKLKNPALLEVSTKKDGKVIIDQKLAKAIDKEQEDAIAALKAISKDVQVVYRYKMVLNGLTIITPKALEEQIRRVGQVTFSERSGLFERPMQVEARSSMMASSSTPSDLFKERNSSKFIGAEALNKRGITGKGISVGIIDTGIDYTHAMLGGDGKGDAYTHPEKAEPTAINPDKANPAFPNKKVVGGIDLVGTDFNAASPDFQKTIPHPDMNPIDESGHGTHVAGTVAGIGDGINTYNGMAPDANLYAIKVFGAGGSTADYVVIAALEYSADPNQDGDVSDRLDVINMSLGGGFGNPHILYSEAIKNLTKGGTFVVASAGNSGHKDYIVGAPSTADDALSVAASVDDGDQNWLFKASKIHLGKEDMLVEAIEAATTKKIEEVGNVTGKLVYIGLAKEDLTEEQKAAVKGNVALIDRGEVSFNDKVKRAAAAGAVGVVVVNNKLGELPFVMGTNDPFDIPAIAISLENGMRIKENMHQNDVTIEFKSDEKIIKKELIDTLTDFTSKGPRSIDGHIKPEISAPGQNVISAQMGGGNKSVQMSGTSMAGPHMAGVMALVKQVKTDLSNEEYKSAVMGTAKIISEGDKRYPVSLQGAGRVQADLAVDTKVVSQQSSLSLGTVGIETKKITGRTIQIRNLSNEEIELNIKFNGSDNIMLSSRSFVKLAAAGTADIPLTFTLDATKFEQNEKVREMDGWVVLEKAGQEVLKIPVLAVAVRLSGVSAETLVVQAGSERDSDGSLAQLKLKADGANGGEALLFNYLASDDRKPVPESYMNADCDLQAVGYRIIDQKDEKNSTEEVIQFAIKMYKPLTSYNICDISILVDANGDGVPEQEILGSSLSSVGLKGDDFATTLLDATKARELRKAFEEKVKDAGGDREKLAELKEDYTNALVDMRGMRAENNSSVAILEVATSKLMKNQAGNLSIQVVVSQNEDNSVQPDDYLDATKQTYMAISLKKAEQSFTNLDDISLIAREEKMVDLYKGYGTAPLMILYPQNKFSVSDMVNDFQMQFVQPTYKLP